jgi:hypothetical protein
LQYKKTGATGNKQDVRFANILAKRSTLRYYAMQTEFAA